MMNVARVILMQSAFERADRTLQWQCDHAHTAKWPPKRRAAARACNMTYAHRTAHYCAFEPEVRITLALDNNEIKPNCH